MSNLTVVLFIFTGVVAFIVALFLSRIAMLSGRSRLKVEEKGVLPEGQKEPEVKVDAPLQEVLFEGFKYVGGSDKNYEEVGKKVMAAFEKELQERISKVSHDLTKKYEAVIEEKTKDQEVLWNKFNDAVVSRQQTEAVIRSLAEGVVVVNPDGKVVMMNPVAEKLLGVSRKEKIGKPIFDGLKDEQVVSIIKKTSQGKPSEIEVHSPQDETKKIIQASSAVLEDENGQTIGMVSVLSDVTRQKELAALKSRFVASVSHELRTPLVAIGQSLALLLSGVTGQLNENQEEFLIIAERNLKRLSRLIDDLLDLSRLESGRLVLERRPVVIEPLIKDTVLTFSTWASSKKIAIDIQLGYPLPEALVDSRRFCEILDKLLDNALKFTPVAGKIVVGAHYDPQRSEVLVSVADNGIGIEKEEQAKIFEKFYQSKNSTHNNISGIRISLSIVKELVELHGGRIWLESEKDKGTKFTFSIPAQSSSS